DNYSLSASLEQPLFTGFRLASLKSAASYNLSADKINHKIVKVEKAKNIELAFWNLYTSQQILKLVDQNLKALREHLSNTEKLLENGLVTKNDLLKLKIEIGTMELNLLEAENNVSIAKASFNKILGFPINSDIKIEVDKISIDEYNPTIEKSLSEAVSNRNELKETKLRLNAIKERESAAKGDWYPQLYAFGNYYYNNPNQRYLPLKDEFNDSWDIGLLLKWNLWNWGGTSAKVERVKQEHLMNEYNFKLLKENIQLEVYNNYLNLKKASKKIELSEIQVESAEENYRITTEKYYQQFATSTDLIDAETTLLNANITMISSRVEYKIGLSEYYRSIGSWME
ncbi:MAG: TolC family protein, partial [Melioribacteraceae bacterium]|nr:TolC family protein [Melioribacteraceae bacterium]